MYPEDLKYTSEHEWLRTVADQGKVRVGITQYAQDALGDVVYISLPADEEHIEFGQVIGEVESTKSVSEVYAPLSGTVAARNSELESQPDLVNSDPYGEGWMIDIRPDDPATLDTTLAGFMDASAYQRLVEEG